MGPFFPPFGKWPLALMLCYHIFFVCSDSYFFLFVCLDSLNNVLVVIKKHNILHIPGKFPYPDHQRFSLVFVGILDAARHIFSKYVTCWIGAS